MPNRSDRDARTAAGGALGRSEAATISTVDPPLRYRCRPHRAGVPRNGTPFHYTAYQNPAAKRSVKRCIEREIGGGGRTARVGKSTQARRRVFEPARLPKLP